MLIFPAIDLVRGQAVRLFKGDYDQMTVYSSDPAGIAEEFVKKGASHIHLVDLEGAKNGDTPNLDTVIDIKNRSGAFCEIGGGIRSMETVEKYLNAGLDRVILGTAAVKDPVFLQQAVGSFGEKVAVGVDIKEGKVAIKGWIEKSTLDAFDFCREMADMGVRTLICTDISRDGAMRGTNRELYRSLSDTFDLQIVASGGVSTMADVQFLKELDLYGAIIGKAYYTGNIDLCEAVKLAEGCNDH